MGPAAEPEVRIRGAVESQLCGVVRIAIGTLRRRFPDLRLADPDADLSRREGILRGMATLPVTFTPEG
ncbi:hypothetical protein [Streptomyces sp. NPDC058326]|uniref:hypothetical protein n=1 Tax=Streptomyces sp. NPDC058326 TaxID=3346447 RepID=UPI0036EFF86C